VQRGEDVLVAGAFRLGEIPHLGLDALFVGAEVLDVALAAAFADVADRAFGRVQRVIPPARRVRVVAATLGVGPGDHHVEVPFRHGNAHASQYVFRPVTDVVAG